MGPARKNPVTKGTHSMKNFKTKLLIIIFAVITMLVLSAVAAQASSIETPGLVVPGNPNGGNVYTGGVITPGEGLVSGGGNGGPLVIIRPEDGNTDANDETNTPADPWQTGSLHYNDASLFPDEAFRHFLESLDGDKNGGISIEEARSYFEKTDGCLDLTDINDTVYDYTGVECFAAWLTGLRCKPTGGVPLKLDVSSLTLLEELVCADCALTALDISRSPALRVLECENNPMETLDLSACPLLADAAENGAMQEDGSTVSYTKGDAILIIPSAANLITGNAPATDAEQPSDPQLSDPSDEPAAADGAAKGFSLFGWLKALLNKILAFFKGLFG